VGTWHTRPEAYTAVPALFTGVQSMNNQELGDVPSLRMPWIVPAVTGLTATGFSVALDRCEAEGGIVSEAEDIGFIAITGGHGVCRKTSCFNAKFIVQHAMTSGHDMGWDDKDTNLEVVHFPEHFEDNNVIAVASKSTRNGDNGGWLRILDVNGHGVTIVVDEDVSLDGERAHESEDVGVIAFSEPFAF